MKEQFDAVKMEVPFADYLKILNKRGLQGDPELGGNCVHQIEVLAEKIKAAGYKVSFIPDSESNHWALLASDGKREFYMDPYLLHHDPVDISDLGKVGQKTVEALPVVDKNPTKIVFKKTKVGFNISSYMPRSRFLQYELVWESKYDLSRRFKEVYPNEDGDPFFHPRRLFNIRVPFENGDVMKLTWMIANGAREIQVGVMGPDPKSSRTFNEQDKFNLEMERLVQRIGTTVPRLISTLSAANDLYQAADPEMIRERMKKEAASILEKL